MSWPVAAVVAIFVFAAARAIGRGVTISTILAFVATVAILAASRHPRD